MAKNLADASSHERQLELFKRQYFQCLKLETLAWPDAVLLKQVAVQEWLFKELFDVENIKYPPPERYQLRVLKELMSRVESAIDDPEEDTISDSLMSYLSSLLASPLHSEAVMVQRRTYVTYTMPDSSLSTVNPSTVTLLESNSVISAGGITGMRTWEAALHLGSYLASSAGRSVVRGKTMLELGAGTGFLSILCAKYLGASGVLATDGHVDVVDWMKTSAALNDLEDDSKMCSYAYRWGTRHPMSEAYPADRWDRCDVILGADVTYDWSLIPALLATLRELFRLYPGVVAIVSATVRNDATFGTFLKACGASISVVTCDTQCMLGLSAYQIVQPAEANKFTIDYIEYAMVPQEQQTGLFYSVKTPIHIIRVTGDSNTSDPFAI